MKMWIFAALLLLGVMASPLLADRTEDIFLLSKDTNDRIIRQEESVKAAEAKVDEAEKRIANIEYSFNSLKDNYFAFVVAIAIFTAILTAQLTFHFVARTFREEIENFSRMKYQSEAVKQQSEIKTKEIAYEQVIMDICPNCGAKSEDDEPYCSKDGGKFMPKKIKVPKLKVAYPSIEQKTEEYGGILERREKKKWYQFWK